MAKKEKNEQSKAAAAKESPVKQNAKKALSISNRAYVLDLGCITMSGSGTELLSDESVKRAYLGG